MAALIELEGVTKAYPMAGESVQALKGVSLSFAAGEFAAVVGASGSGKSTLLYLLGLMTTPSGGAYRFDGQDVGALSDDRRSALRGREIGFVFQSFHLVPQLDVLQNVLLAARYAGNGHGDPAARAKELLDRVGLSKRLKHRPAELSGGEMQRVALARALLSGPRLILADEPTGNLDEKTGEEIFSLLASLPAEGKTVIVVTHNLHLAGRIPRRVTLKDGEVAA